MRTSDFTKDIDALLQEERRLSVSDFAARWPGIPMPTVYSRIRVLLKEGKLSPAGRGKYLAVHKPKFKVPVTQWMLEVNSILIDNSEAAPYCLYERGNNLYVETPRQDIPLIINTLKQHSSKVIRQKDADAFPAVLEGYIIVGPLITDAPVAMEDGITSPSLEKMLVDSLISKGADRRDRQLSFQKAMEVYPVNVNRMMRYAARRGIKEELNDSLTALDTQRLDMISALQKYLSGIPVLRAWVFGSFARGEETAESDLDLLVDYDHSSGLSLLDIIRYKNKLEEILGREVDLVENGYLRPFAVASAERDRYLVYER